MLEPLKMMQLSNIAYAHEQDIPAAVTQLDPELSVVWGPAWHSSVVGTPFSLAFVVRSASTGAATVVIRGTDPWSLEAWAEQDFAIDSTVPFATFVPGAPADARLSKGAATGLKALLDLVPKHREAKLDLLAFLNGRDDLSSLAVTGHSLGGTLTGPLFAALKGLLKQPPAMDLMSFAGLTPGNQAFADHLNGLTPSQSWRVVNPYDIAPLCFTDVRQVEDIYGDLQRCGEASRLLLQRVFDSAAVAYVQPGGAPTLLPKEFNKELLWSEQVLHQHHASTYLGLVSKLPG